MYACDVDVPRRFSVMFYIYIYIYMLHFCYFTILISIESVCCGSGVGKLDVTITDHAY